MDDTKLKYKIIDYLEDKCNKSKINNYIIGQNLRALHVAIPIFLMTLVFLASKQIVKLVIIYFIFVIFFFIYFDSCLLTLLERRLCNDKFTIFDILLEIFNLPIESKTQKKVSKIVLALIFVLCILVYYFRFCIKD
jgi:hypothetical protein